VSGVVTFGVAVLFGGNPRRAAAATFLSDELPKLKVGLATLEDLVAHWDERTLNCRFAEVNRELLRADQKKALLEEATKNALMQKDGAAVQTVCKRDPEAVRLALGLDDRLREKNGVPAAFAAPGLYAALDTAAAPNTSLRGADAVIRRGLEYVDDDFDEYVAAEEAWLEAISALDTASYASGAADFGAIVSTEAGDSDRPGAGDARFLDDARRAAVKARAALAVIVGILDKAAAAA